MTSRPGNGALGLWQNHRTKRACNLVRIIRTDGNEVLVTDHDRKLTFEGQTYSPAIFTAMSAERREVALSTPDQELHGIIDGTTMLIPDLLGQRYRGAEVYHVVTDWQYPWLPIARNYKTVRGIRWDGLRFVAMLDGVTQVLERPSGGRFGGVASFECPYVLGGTHCGKDISGDVKSVTVDTVTDARIDFTLTSMSGISSDDYYRDGELEWLTGDNAGVISPIYAQEVTSKRIELFTPTPFDVQAGDTATMRPGCNGLFSTCKTKFSNQDNFGGNHLQPQPGDLLEVAR